MTVDQLALLSEKRDKGIMSQNPSHVDVTEWRVPIAEIEKRTNLDFGDAVREADTITSGQQPTVGEARILLKQKSDILPA